MTPEDLDEFDDCRYAPFQLSATFTNTFEWGVQDYAYVPPMAVLDWHTKGNKKRIWRNTYKNAADLARIMNKDHQRADFVTKGDLSLSQLIHYSNLHKENRKTGNVRTRRPNTGKVNSTHSYSFRLCEDCGRMVKGNHSHDNSSS